MRRDWKSKPDPHLIEGIHPGELTYYTHINKEQLDKFEAKFGNVLAYRAIWTKATNIKTDIRKNVIERHVLPAEQEAILKTSLDQLLYVILVNLNMTSKMNDDVVRNLTSMIFWEIQYGSYTSSVTKDEATNTYIIADDENDEMLRKALQSYSKLICNRELDLKYGEEDPKLSRYVDKVQVVYKNFKTFSDKRSPSGYVLDPKVLNDEYYKIFESKRSEKEKNN